MVKQPRAALFRRSLVAIRVIGANQLNDTEDETDDFEHYEVEEHEHQSAMGEITMCRVVDYKGNVVSRGLDIDRAERLAEYLNEEAGMRVSERMYSEVFGEEP